MNKDREVRVYRSRRNHVDPCIILEGKWLMEMGFNPGDYLTITKKAEHLEVHIKEKYVDAQ